MRNAKSNRDLGIGNRRQFKDGNQFLWFAIRPAIAVFGLGVVNQVEYLNITLPERLAAIYFMHRHRLNPR